MAYDATERPSRAGAREHGRDRNVNGLERLLSLAAGGGIAAYALKRKDWTGLALGVLGGALVERGVTGRCAVYHALGVSTADGGLTRQHGRAATVDAQRAQKIERSMTVNGHDRETLYAFWRNFENLPRVFQHLERVEVLSATRSRWTAKAPAGRTVSYEAEIVNEIPGQLIAWKSLPGTSVPNAGSVHFADLPGDRGVEITVVLEYEPPAGKLGVAVARLFGEEPAIQVREDLRRYKALLETGELPVSANPGQGGDPRATWNARATRDLERTVPIGDDAHEPEHRPPPGDAQRGVNSANADAVEVRA